MQRFTGRTILVTGAGSGIGAATMLRILEEGGRVAAADLNRAELEKVAASSGAGALVLTAGLDVADQRQVQAWVASAVERFGAVDGLVNGAGIRGLGSVTEIDRAVWDRNLAVNLTGTVNTMEAFAQALRKAGRPGAIVNLSSMAGIVGLGGRVPYVAAKFGVSGITRAAALDLAPHGIRVNAIAPGMIRTAMTAPLFLDPANAARVRAANPSGREGLPEEVAATAAFLLSDDASYITGAIIPVDGGATAGAPSL